MSLNKNKYLRYGRVSYLFNPAIGLIPLLFYAIFYTILPIWVNYIVTLAIYSILFIAYYITFRKGQPLLLIISFFFVAICYIISFVPFSFHERVFLISIPDIGFLILLNLVIRMRRKIIRRVMQYKGSEKQRQYKIALYEFFFLCRYLNAFIIINIIIINLYVFLLGGLNHPHHAEILMNTLRVLTIIVLIVIEQIRLYFINQKFKQEEWLPIINEHAQVIGKIARSESYMFKERFLHPRVRIFVFYQDKLFLVQRRRHRYFDVGKWDIPLHNDLHYKQDFQQCINALLQSVGFPLSQQPHYFFHYLYERNEVRRMMFVYCLNIQNEKLIQSKTFLNGKLWTLSQIKENLGKDVFARCFEEEYELMEKTVFPALKMMTNNE